MRRRDAGRPRPGAMKAGPRSQGGGQLRLLSMVPVGGRGSAALRAARRRGLFAALEPFFLVVFFFFFGVAFFFAAFFLVAFFFFAIRHAPLLSDVFAFTR